MIDEFENPCWQDIMPPELLQLAARSKRKTFVGPSPALLAIDLYEQVYKGGNKPIAEAVKEERLSCGEYAYAAIPPTQRLFAAARGAGIPTFYSTMETRTEARPQVVWATSNAPPRKIDPTDYDIRPEFKPQPGDIIIPKQRASVFYGTPIAARFVQLGVRSLIICGESTSGCVRASAVEAQEHGFHVTVVEQCCFDRNIVTHKVNLFDLHHKYADVMHVDEVVAHLEKMPAASQAAQ